ncbi:hypothetical protein ACEPAI_5673 [Sanghuangporus weigelae]
MIFNKYIALLALPILAAATPMPGGGSPTTKPAATSTVTVTATSTATQPASQCNTGDLQCCNSVQSAGSSDAAGLLGLLGIVLDGLDIPVGLTCNPISVIGTGTSGCSAHPVCCEDNSHGNLISLGCIPVNLSL